MTLFFFPYSSVSSVPVTAEVALLENRNTFEKTSMKNKNFIPEAKEIEFNKKTFQFHPESPKH